MEAAESIVVNDGLAERDGFEPAVQVIPYDCLAGSPVQLLKRPFDPTACIHFNFLRPHPLTSAARMMASEISRIDLRSFMLFC